MKGVANKSTIEFRATVCLTRLYVSLALALARVSAEVEGTQHSPGAAIGAGLGSAGVGASGSGVGETGPVTKVGVGPGEVGAGVTAVLGVAAGAELVTLQDKELVLLWRSF